LFRCHKCESVRLQKYVKKNEKSINLPQALRPAAPITKKFRQNLYESAFEELIYEGLIF
jgi:hypothetical protein